MYDDRPVCRLCYGHFNQEYGCSEIICPECRERFNGYTVGEARYIMEHNSQFQFINGRYVKIREDERPKRTT